jgi:hypothetical protein
VSARAALGVFVLASRRVVFEREEALATAHGAAAEAHRPTSPSRFRGRARFDWAVAARDAVRMSNPYTFGATSPIGATP